jgi:hypothetical protein
VGFDINGVNPALNICTSQVTRLGFLKMENFSNNIE